MDDIRDLRETVKYAPTQGKYKIYLVDEVHMLSKAAFNALLKTLEEPPPHVIFIFATTEPNKIPDTILSRVQRFDFLRIPSAAVVQRLASIAESEGATISENALRLIAHAGEGSMRDSQSLLDKVIAFAGPDISDEEVTETLGLIDRTLLYFMLDGLVTGAPEKCLQAIDQVYGYGFELSQFTTEMLELTRNATFLQLSSAAHRYIDISGEEKAELLEIVRDVEPDVLSRTFSALLDVHDQVARASRPRIVLEMAVARLATNPSTTTYWRNGQSTPRTLSANSAYKEQAPVSAQCARDKAREVVANGAQVLSRVVLAIKNPGLFPNPKQQEEPKKHAKTRGDCIGTKAQTYRTTQNTKGTKSSRRIHLRHVGGIKHVARSTVFPAAREGAQLKHLFNRNPYFSQKNPTYWT